MKNDKRTCFEDRPWTEGAVCVMEEDGVDPSLIQILCYLKEEDPVVPTRVVYRCLDIDKCFDEEVSSAAKWIKPLVVRLVLTPG